MKALAISSVFAASLFALAGAVFFTRSAAEPEPELGGAPALRSAQTALEGRITEVLDRLDRVEAELASVQRNLEAGGGFLRAAAAPPVAGAAAVPGPAEAKAAPSKLAAAVLSTGDADRLRSFVHEVIQEEREERRLADERRREEDRKEAEAHFQGPYGDFNYRVNRLGKKLGLTEAQKQHYHQLVALYSGRIEEMRQGLDRDNPEIYKAYRERKKQVQEEFESLVMQSLTPPQAQSFKGLSFSDRSAAIEAATGAKEAAASAVEVLGASEGYTLKLGGRPVQPRPDSTGFVPAGAQEAVAPPPPVAPR